MSLYKQLWLTVTGLLALVFACTIALNGLSTATHLEQQLSSNNADNAAALAQALAQQGNDWTLPPATLFDVRSYELIQLTDQQGNTTILHKGAAQAYNAPGWFTDFFPLEVAPGSASIRRDGQVLGTLRLQGRSGVAYQILWDSAWKTAIVFLIAILVAGALASYLLKRMLRPLDDMAEQARAIGERRFVTIPEPAAVEFHQVAAAINQLSPRVRSMLAKKTEGAKSKSREKHLDKVTGLIDRDEFMQVLAASLHHKHTNARGTISIIHLGGLNDLNWVFGRKAVDGTLVEIGHMLNQLDVQNSGWVASRLNGSDFAILAPGTGDPMSVAREIQTAMREVLVNRGMESHVQLPAASTTIGQGESSSDMLVRLDGALAAAIAEGQSNINIASKEHIPVMPVREQLNKWRDIFRQAFDEQKFSITPYPVAGLEGELLHLESPARLQWQNELLTASQFLPWINRLELASDLDKLVVNLALRQITKSGKPICINLSVAAVTDSVFLSWLGEKLSANATEASVLWMEVEESMAYRYLENFTKLCSLASRYDTRIGIEHGGHRLADMSRLKDVGLEYMKIDAIFIGGIDQNAGNQTLVRTLCSIGNSMGLTMIAEGLGTDAERQTLKELGIDGVTGPGVSALGQYKD